ncbi:MAG TPA: FAD-linked oxidase C-terminal domain-containing protein [Steroidobacteraceae bacterium]|nr:FAD-linked oxidase C-terminal domain-containing protein [Steroidobacteraceae bacterium]
MRQASVVDEPPEESAASPGQRRAVARALCAVLPADCVLSGEEELRPYECDGLSVFHRQPLVVVLPRTEAELVAAVRECRRLGVPIVARGAGTGLSGGAMPHASGVVLSLARFDRILAIDPDARTARVQPGVRNLAVSEAAAPFGLFYAPDPSSQIACSIGGNVAENSGGVHCLKYGLTVHNVLGLRACTVEGELVELGGGALDAPGLDLLAVTLGSEGLLLIVTEVLLKLLPKAALARVVMASFDDVGKAGTAVAAIIAAGIIPAGLEMMDRKATVAVEPFVKAGYDLGAEAILLAESDGTAEEVADEVAAIEAVLRGAGATAIAVSSSEAERLRFWSGRKNAFPAAGRLSPDYYCMDGTIPRKALGTVLREIGAMERTHGLECMNVFHAGDGNLHPLILFDANRPGEWERAEAFGADILELCVRLGGTITGEHGVGVEKLNSMCVQFSPAERAAFFAVKRAFDPPGLLNPGKAIPTLRRCAEYGRMHVRRGALPHPELPRF